MISIDLVPELEITLEEVANQERTSPSEILKQLIKLYINRKQDSELLLDVVNDLPEISCFKNKDPLVIQSNLRDEWS